MHERHVMADIVRRLDELERAEGAPILTIHVRLGALSHFTPEHFREHFEDATRLTALAGIDVEIEESDDPADPAAQGVLLSSVEIAAGA